MKELVLPNMSVAFDTMDHSFLLHHFPIDLGFLVLQFTGLHNLCLHTQSANLNSSYSFIILLMLQMSTCDVTAFVVQS